jgi:hypothetical protein
MPTVNKWVSFLLSPKIAAELPDTTKLFIHMRSRYPDRMSAISRWNVRDVPLAQPDTAERVR